MKTGIGFFPNSRRKMLNKRRLRLKRRNHIHLSLLHNSLARSMNNWQVDNSSCLRKRNRQRSGKRSSSSRHRKPQKTKEKEKLHLFPRRSRESRIQNLRMIPNMWRP